MGVGEFYPIVCIRVHVRLSIPPVTHQHKLFPILFKYKYEILNFDRRVSSPRDASINHPSPYISNGHSSNFPRFRIRKRIEKTTTSKEEKKSKQICIGRFRRSTLLLLDGQGLLLDCRKRRLLASLMLRVATAGVMKNDRRLCLPYLWACRTNRTSLNI